MSETSTPAVVGPCPCGGYGIVYDAERQRQGLPCHEPLAQSETRAELTEGGGSRPLEPLEWAEIQTDAMMADDDTWKPDEQLNWQALAFRKLWIEQESLRALGFRRAYLVYAYYASRAGDHPDWHTEGTAAHTVRLAREAAIAAERERQGGA